MSTRIPIIQMPGVKNQTTAVKVRDVGEELQQDFYGMLHENMELTRKHHPYEQEMREQGAIINGDAGLLLKSWAEVHDGVIVPQAEEVLRSKKKYCYHCWCHISSFGNPWRSIVGGRAYFV